MKKFKFRKTAGMVIDTMMYLIMFMQMLYVFTGNIIHEWMGIIFFVCLLLHLIIKRKWFVSFFRKKHVIPSARFFADCTNILLLLCICIMMISSMGVSRTIFPNIIFMESPSFHRFMGTLMLTISIVHGGMHTYFVSKNKKKVVILIVIAAAATFSLGNWGVPYLNRHFRTVEITNTEVYTGKKLAWNNKKPLVVYFTRVGNTDFEENIDAVSGASLMIRGGILTGNTEFIADSFNEILDCDVAPITLTDYKYPSSYSETCSVAGEELKNNYYPTINPIDVSDYDSILLVYPIWWYTLPMPVQSFLKDNDFSGKDVYMIATQGSNGFGSSIEDAVKLVPSANVHEVISIYCDDIPKSRNMLLDWMEANGLAE